MQSSPFTSQVAFSFVDVVYLLMQMTTADSTGGIMVIRNVSDSEVIHGFGTFQQID